ncbi:MAG TPA: class I SAM-dependent methyltransferase [Labilithrix sp.]|jgi:2-polyprenyl-3-methyl-5-hydroxy-6-metoxy-1,4-benzoquinol methylase|nr:class I SAM-dependent methyltransferase [Labilithrix sp.]
MPEIEREPLSTRVVRVLSRGPRPAPQRFEAPEVYGRQAIARIARSLPPLERAYANIRFSILRPKLLSVMDLLLPDEGRILDIGCGFGLFAAYFGQTQPERRIVGVDPNAQRVEMARRVSDSVGLSNTFVAGDARDVALQGPFSGAYVLDVMHHIPEKDQLPLLQRLRDLLAPRGVLVIKDITTEPTFGLEFTRLLDRVMVGWDEPLRYRHHREWGEMLAALGFHVRMVRVPDVLPYPHVVIAATKR